VLWNELNLEKIFASKEGALASRKTCTSPLFRRTELDPVLVVVPRIRSEHSKILAEKSQNQAKNAREG
jgi:hypothetical protein